MFDKILNIVAYINVIVIMFGLMVLVTHGPVVLFQSEPYKTFGELQRNVAFWVFVISNAASAYLILGRTE